MRVPTAICLLALSVAVLPAPGPASGQPRGEERPILQDRCRADPDEGDRTRPDAGRNTDDADRSLSELLEDCGGVLDPPATGGRDMVEPPPDTGETPVIRPRDLPDRQDPE